MKKAKITKKTKVKQKATKKLSLKLVIVSVKSVLRGTS